MTAGRGFAVAGMLLTVAFGAGAVAAVEVPAGRVDAMAVWKVPGVATAVLDLDGQRWDSVSMPDGCEIRLTPRRAGAWPWRMISPGQHVEQGTWTVAPSGQPPTGPIRLVGQHLAFPDGRPFVPLGPNIAWMEGDDPVPGFRRAFGRLAEGGGTHARVWLCSWCLGPAEGQDAQRAAQVDAMLAAARAAGLRITLVLTNHTDASKQPGWSDMPLRPAVHQRLVDAVRRWGADDTVLAWEVGNELDLAEPRPEVLDTWLRAAIAVVRAEDHERRPVIASWSGDGWKRSHAPVEWFGIHPYVHEFSEGDAAFRTRTRDGVVDFIDAAQHTRLWWPMEGGYQGTTEDNPGNDRDHDGLLVRQHLWAGACLGLAPAMNWWWDTHIDARHLWPLYGACGRILARLDATDPELQTMPINAEGALRVLGRSSPTQALVWPQVRVDTWYAQVVQGQPRLGLPLASAVVLGGFRPAAAFTWERWNPITGVQRAAQTVSSDHQGNVRLTLPAGIADEVWVVRLTPAAMK